MADDIVIKIAGDAKKYQDEVDKVEKTTEDLNSQLETLTKISGVAFAGLTAGLGLAVKAFAESEQVASRVNAIIKATGGTAGVTGDQVLEMASKLEAVTTFGDEAIATGTGILLTFKRIGADVLPQATEAMLDLATRLGTDAPAAAEILGKALNNPVDGLTRLKKAGIDFTDGEQKQIQAMIAAGDVAEAQRVVLDKLGSTIGGLARSEVKTTTGAFKQLRETFDDVAEAVGGNLAPALKAGAQALNSVLTFAKEHEQLTNLATAVALGATAAAGVATFAGAASLALLKFRAAMIAAGIASEGTAVAVKGLIGATGIGLLVVALTEVALNWGTIWPRMRAVFAAFAANISELASNVGGVLGAAFTFNFTKLQEQLGQLKSTLKKGYDEAFAAIPQRKTDDVAVGDGGAALEAERKALTEEVALKKQKEDEKEAADKLAKAKELERVRAHAEVLRLEAENSSAELIQLTKEESEAKLVLLEAHNADERKAAQDRFDQLQALLADQRQIESDQRDALNQNILQKSSEFQAMSEEQQKAFLKRHQVALQSSIDTETTAQRKYLADKLKGEIDNHNQFLQEQQKYGTAYATVQQLLRDSEVKKTTDFLGRLQELQRSNLGVLRTIGKAAALAQIAMNTASAATQALGAFPIPFVGPALGMAAAIAIAAYGIEQAAEVTGIIGAAKGGLMVGGIAGVDSIPTLTMPDELIAPPKNFDEVVNGVAKERIARGELPGVSATGAGQQPIEVVSHIKIDLTRNAGRIIQVQAVQDQAMGIYRGT
jgi:hypothetical protein